jgi:hypothetical protein
VGARNPGCTAAAQGAAEIAWMSSRGSCSRRCREHDAAGAAREHGRLQPPSPSSVPQAGGTGSDASCTYARIHTCSHASRGPHAVASARGHRSVRRATGCARTRHLHVPSVRRDLPVTATLTCDALVCLLWALLGLAPLRLCMHNCFDQTWCQATRGRECFALSRTPSSVSCTQHYCTPHLPHQLHA